MIKPIEHSRYFLIFHFLFLIFHINLFYFYHKTNSKYLLIKREELQINVIRLNLQFLMSLFMSYYDFLKDDLHHLFYFVFNYICFNFHWNQFYVLSPFRKQISIYELAHFLMHMLKRIIKIINLLSHCVHHTHSLVWILLQQ